VSELPDELKSLTESIEENVKALLIAAGAIALFMTAPRADETLQKGARELQESRTWSNRIDEDLASSAKANTESAAKSIGAKLGLTATSVGGEERALGLPTPFTVGAVADILSKNAGRCNPRAEDTVVAGFRALTDGYAKKTTSLRFRAALDAEVVPLAVAVIKDARALGDRRRESPTTQPPPLRPEPRPTRPKNENGQPVEKPNPDHERWLQEKAALDSAKNAGTALNTAASALQASMAELGRRLDVGREGNLEAVPPYVIADLALAERATHLFVPLACVKTPALSDGVRRAILGDPPAAILPELRSTSDWERFAASDWVRAESLVKEAIDKDKDELEMFEFHVPTDLVDRMVPWLLVFGAVWHIAYLWRFRELSRLPAYKEAARALVKSSPILPTRSNLGAALVVSAAVAAAVLAVASRKGFAQVLRTPTALLPTVLALVLSMVALGAAFLISLD
jgi:hypothetical protein